MNTTNVYDNLYNNMKNRFTVVHDNCEYTLGEYMLMKADKKKETSNLPVAQNNSHTATAITTFFRYVNDKLTLKAPPVKDKTMRRFPFRTCAAAVLSAIVACSFVISYGSATINKVTGGTPSTVEVETFEAEEPRHAEYTQK